MEHKPIAYLLRSNAEAVAMPADELLSAFERVAEESGRKQSSLFLGNPAVHEFLYAIKLAIQACKSCPAVWDECFPLLEDAEVSDPV
jgi:hypothetical protein